MKISDSNLELNNLAELGDGTCASEKRPVLRVSAKASRHDGMALTDAEIEAAEEEALAWARKSNCC
jgi:hypothetical protein